MASKGGHELLVTRYLLRSGGLILYNILMKLKLKHVKGWFESEEKFLKTPVGIFLLGAFLGELAPDPTDAIHFWLQQYIQNHHLPKLLLASIQIFDWYFMTALYFLLLLILAYFLHINKVKTIKRISVIGGILSIGAVIGIVARFLL